MQSDLNFLVWADVISDSMIQTHAYLLYIKSYIKIELDNCEVILGELQLVEISNLASHPHNIPAH